MSKYQEIYDMVTKLYENKKYKQVIEKVDKFINIGFDNQKWIHRMKFMRAKSLRYLGRFNEAIAELIVLSKQLEDNLYSKLELFYIYYYLNRYEEAFELLPQLYEMPNKYVSNHSLLIGELVIRKNLGMKATYRKGTRSDYIKEQIVNYNEEIAYEHILDHTHETMSYNEHSIFTENIDIKYLMECVKEDVKTNKKVNVNDMMEIHYFAVSGIGHDDSNMCNYLKVVVVPGTPNIIAMYPSSYIEDDNVQVLNCNIDKLFKREEKQKTVSRIDRFNKRFNLS